MGVQAKLRRYSVAVVLALVVTSLVSARAAGLNLETATIADLNAAFASGTLTSEKLVEAYLKRANDPRTGYRSPEKAVALKYTASVALDLDDPVYLAAKNEALAATKAAILALFAKHRLDAIVYPTSPRPATLIKPDGLPPPSDSPTNLANATGFPDLIVPAGMTPQSRRGGGPAPLVLPRRSGMVHRMPEHPPALFERVPRGLFGPLGDLYAELYWELLAELYRHEFEREPFIVVRSTALDIAEAAIRGSRLWTERPQDLDALAREDETSSRERQGIRGPLVLSAQPDPASVPPFDPEAIDEATAIRALARRLVARLENTGWMHFQYRGGTGEIMSFHPYAARILQTLLDVARDEQPVFQGLVHSIAALLEPKAFAQRPGVSLLEARRHTLELSRELKILERNIHLFIQRVLDDATTAADVLEEGFERYEHAVMANYHRLKTVDNVYRQRSAILQRLDAIERDLAALANAADWYAAQRGTSAAEGQLAVKSDLALLRSHFDAIPQLVDDIDTRNARFSGVALRKIRYFLRQDRRTEGQLQFIVDALAKDEAPELEFDAFRCELLAGNFLYTPPTARARAAPQRLVDQPIANRERIRQEAAGRVRRLFARRRLEEFVLTVLDGRQAAPMRDIPVHGDHDYVRLLYLASYGLDGESTFELLPSPERLRKAAYGYPDGTVEKRSATGERRTQTSDGTE